MTKRAKKRSVYVCLLAMPVGAATVGLVRHVNQPRQLKADDATRETDAAYRDGFYLGTRDGQEGRKARPSVGRWNSAEDRASFVIGYQKGHQEALAARIAAHRD